MDSLDNLYKSYGLIKNYSHLPSFETKVSMDKNVITESFILKGKVDFFREHFDNLNKLFLSSDMAFFQASEEFESVLSREAASATERELKYIIGFKQNVLNGEHLNLNFVFYNISNFMSFSGLFLKDFKLVHLNNLETKIRVRLFDDDEAVIESSIFSSTQGIRLDIHDWLVNHELYKEFSLASLPYALPKLINYSQETYKQIIIELMDVLSTYKRDDRFYFESRNSSYLNISDIESSKEVYNDLSDIISFIFRDSQHYYDKLLIVVKLFSDKLSGNVGLYVDSKFLQTLYKELEEHHNLYVEKTVNSFIQDKKIIFEKQLELSRGILERIKSLNTEIYTHIVTVSGVIITTFFLKGVGDLLAPILGAILVLVMLIVKLTSGVKKDSFFIESELKIIEEQYPRIYNYNEKLVEDLKEQHIEPYLVKLRRNEFLNISVLVVFLISLVSWICIITWSEYKKEIVTQLITIISKICF